jgi:hypothetical protein
MKALFEVQERVLNIEQGIEEEARIKHNNKPLTITISTC